MAKYATLYSFTDQGIRNVKESPSRLKAAISQAEGMGVRVLGAYYTEGPYDLVVISEADDEKAASAFALGYWCPGEREEHHHACLGPRRVRRARSVDAVTRALALVPN